MNSSQDIKMRELCMKSPRMTTLFHHFEEIAAGNKQVPGIPITGDASFLSQGEDLSLYHEILQRNMGTFYKHLCASVPYLLEEHCRMGVAIGKLAQRRAEENSQTFTLYETSSADGANARTISEFTGGVVRTLTDTPNVSNGINFHALCQHDFSDIHIGSFVDITPEYLAAQQDRPYFKAGFDVIYENTTFQFYGPQRTEQIQFVARVLKEEGIMIFCEKLLNVNSIEYERREVIKDTLFKSRYFSQNEITWKNAQMLQEMEKGQVTLEVLVEAIKQHFKYIYMIWNSANFYEIAASNSESAIYDFVSLLAPPHVPSLFCCEEKMIRQLSP